MPALRPIKEPRYRWVRFLPGVDRKLRVDHLASLELEAIKAVVAAEVKLEETRMDVAKYLDDNFTFSERIKARAEAGEP